MEREHYLMVPAICIEMCTKSLYYVGGLFNNQDILPVPESCNCYFSYLHSTNMEDLREKTHTEHYEIFRRRRLQEMGFADTGEDNQPVRYVPHVTY